MHLNNVKIVKHNKKQYNNQYIYNKTIQITVTVRINYTKLTS